MTRRINRSRERRDARYSAAIRRQIDFNRGLARHGHDYAPIEDFLRPGDTAERHQLINGIPANQWGTWCQHGARIVEPDPDSLADSPDFPAGRIVDPWPCDADGCTREQFEQDMAQEAAEHDAWQAEECHRLVTS